VSKLVLGDGLYLKKNVKPELLPIAVLGAKKILRNLLLNERDTFKKHCSNVNGSLI
jgi:hypothetical protein